MGRGTGGGGGGVQGGRVALDAAVAPGERADQEVLWPERGGGLEGMGW